MGSWSTMIYSISCMFPQVEEMVVQMVNNINLGGKLISGKMEKKQERQRASELKEEEDAEKLEEEGVEVKKAIEAEVEVSKSEYHSITQQGQH